MNKIIMVMYLKKIFEAVGIITLLLFSFVFTEKTAYVAINQDDIMKQIENIKNEYFIAPLEPVITENTFIPGKCGLELDTKASYKALKKIGVFTENSLVFKEVCPKEILKNNKNKFIINGNKIDKKVSLIFVAQSNYKLQIVLNILSDNNVKANIFVDGAVFENNNDLIVEISKEHIIGNLSYNGDYNNPSFIWMTTIIKKFNENYCYSENLNESVLKVCQKNNSYTIVPSSVIKNNPALTLNKNISNGSIISFYINDEVVNELSLMLKYIKSKGYDIVTLEELLIEL